MLEFLAIDSDGYIQTNSLCAVIAAWLNVSKRSRVDVGKNRPACQGVKCM